MKAKVFLAVVGVLLVTMALGVGLAFAQSPMMPYDRPMGPMPMSIEDMDAMHEQMHDQMLEWMPEELAEQCDAMHEQMDAMHEAAGMMNPGSMMDPGSMGAGQMMD